MGQFEYLRGMIPVPAEEVIEKKACWDEEYTRHWAQKTSGSNVVDYVDIVESQDMSVVEKLWVTWAFPVFDEDIRHQLAITFAEHWLNGEEPGAKDYLEIKRYWLSGAITDETLERTTKEAWSEARIFPTVASTAFAMARDANVAIQGACARAGGFYGANVVASEKKWQWEIVLKQLRRTYGIRS